MWQERQPDDENRHALNQQARLVGVAIPAQGGLTTIEQALEEEDCSTENF
jgi:hypothetical protein